MTNKYTTRFFDAIIHEDPKMASALYPFYKLQNLVHLIEYRLTENERTLDKLIEESIELAKKDEFSAGDYYYEAGLFSILRNDIKKGKYLIEEAIKNANPEMMEFKSFGALSGIEYETNGIETDYRYVLENIGKACSLLDKAYEYLCSIEKPEKIIQELKSEKEKIILEVMAHIRNAKKKKIVLN